MFPVPITLTRTNKKKPPHSFYWLRKGLRWCLGAPYSICYGGGVLYSSAGMQAVPAGLWGQGRLKNCTVNLTVVPALGSQMCLYSLSSFYGGARSLCCCLLRWRVRLPRAPFPAAKAAKSGFSWRKKFSKRHA